MVGSTPSTRYAPVIPVEHSARLIALGYVTDIANRLRMTTPGRAMMASGTVKLRRPERLKSKKLVANPTEHKCPECDGTGFPLVAQPDRLGVKIYPTQCKECLGKGRVAN
jgi:DnaJ-class molecular chaperone